jgi:hypothetical protein
MIGEYPALSDLAAFVESLFDERYSTAERLAAQGGGGAIKLASVARALREIDPYTRLGERVAKATQGVADAQAMAPRDGVIADPSAAAAVLRIVDAVESYRRPEPHACVDLERRRREIAADARDASAWRMLREEIVDCLSDYDGDDDDARRARLDLADQVIALARRGSAQ